MASENIEFKMYLRKIDKKSEIRRFSINSDFLNNFEYLNIKIKKVFPKLKNKRFSLLWNDNEDEVTISSDEELILALSCMQDNIKKMYIELKHFDRRDLLKLHHTNTQSKITAGPLPNCNVRSLDQLCESQKDNKLFKSNSDKMIASKTKPNQIQNNLTTCINGENNNSASTGSFVSCSINEKSLQNDPTSSLGLKSYQLGKQNDLTEADANSDVIANDQNCSDVETNCEKFTELSKVVNELADLTKILNIQCQNISHHVLEQSNALDNFTDHLEVSEDASPLDTNIQVLHQLTENMIQLKNRFSSMNVIWENKNPIYAQSDVCDFLENLENSSAIINTANVATNSDAGSNETLLFDLDSTTHECDNCSSVKTISESSESMEERWTLLNNDDLDIEPSEIATELFGQSSNLLEFQTSAVEIPDTLSEINTDPKHSNLINEAFDSTSVEVKQSESISENAPPNLENRAIFPHIAAALDILAHMGFDFKDNKLLQLTELYDGNVEAVLDTLLFDD